MQLDSISTLRKAAVLIASLDTDTADRLLEQMGPEHAACVRSMLMQLGEIGEAEQERVLADFFARPSSGSDDVELTVSVAAQRLAEAPQGLDTDVASRPDHDSIFAKTMPAGDFTFLEQVPANELYEALEREHPQTISLVVAHMAPTYGAAVLRAFTPLLRKEILERMERSSVVDAEALSAIERHLRQRFESHILQASLSPARRDHLASLRRLLEPPANMAAASDASTPATNWPHSMGIATFSPIFGEDATEANGGHAPESGTTGVIDDVAYDTIEALTGEADDDQPQGVDDSPAPSPLLEFEELLSLAAADFFEVFEQADSRLVMLALAGASRRMFERFVARFTPAGAAEYERHLEQLRPFPLSDVYRAQRALAEIAGRRLAPAKTAAEKARRFAAAA